MPSAVRYCTVADRVVVPLFLTSKLAVPPSGARAPMTVSMADWSSSRIVPWATSLASMAFSADDSASLNVSFGSAAVSSRNSTVTTVSSALAAMVSVPEAAT